MYFKIDYVATLPLEGNSPKVIIIDNNEDNKNFIYKIDFINNDNGKIIKSCYTNSNRYVFGERQWFTNWLINIYDECGILVHTDIFNLYNKVVFIKFDAFALGDNISWIPYVEEFRKKHNCKVICSTFYNEIFKNCYSDILFVKPNTTIDNVYAQYYIGANNDNNLKYCPINVNNNSLQHVAEKTLGFDCGELKPNLLPNIQNHLSRKIKEKYICISEYGSDIKKHWKEKDGWQRLVDYLNNKGYKVLVISKEKTNLNNIIDLTGDYSLMERMNDLYYCDFFIGVSSGLSWLSWSLNKHVVMISDVTPYWHEFQSDITRVCKNSLGWVDYSSEDYSSFEEVIEKIDKLIN